MVIKDRSPKSPRNTLRAAVEAVGKLFIEARRAPLSREAAAKALGYSGITGVSSTILGSLSGYGLTQKKGAHLMVSDLALAILHPRSPEQLTESLQRAALAHPIFASLAETHLECAQNVIVSELIHRGFFQESAVKTAKVFLDNVQFAGLTSQPYSGSLEFTEDDEGNDETSAPESTKPESPLKESIQPRIVTLQTATHPNVLATYKIPLGSNEAELVFTGNVLEPDDFDALIDYVEIFKKQFERKRATEAEEKKKASPESGEPQKNPSGP